MRSAAPTAGFDVDSASAGGADPASGPGVAPPSQRLQGVVRAALDAFGPENERVAQYGAQLLARLSDVEVLRG